MHWRSTPMPQAGWVVPGLMLRWRMFLSRIGDGGIAGTPIVFVVAASWRQSVRWPGLTSPSIVRTRRGDDFNAALRRQSAPIAKLAGGLMPSPRESSGMPKSRDRRAKLATVASRGCPSRRTIEIETALCCCEPLGLDLAHSPLESPLTNTHPHTPRTPDKPHL